MDDSGNIYRECKCGETVMYDRDCPKCSAKSTTAADLAESLKSAIEDEIPDPFGKLGEELRKEHQRRVREKRG